MEKDVIGRCVGETSLTDVSFVSKEMPKMGEYVTLEYDNKIILGMIESLVRGSVALNNDIYDPETIERIKHIEGDDYYIKGNVKILGDIDYLKIPRTPAPPGTEVKLASSEVLDKIFRFKDGLKLGHLISNENVEVNLNINKMVSRHLAILAMTGAGKSNTVSVIIDGLLANNGCPLIFDMHSEYVGAEFPNGKVNKINPIINPLYLEFSEILQLANINGKSFVQERYFRKAFNLAKEDLRSGVESTHNFILLIRSKLESWYQDEETYSSKERNTMMDVINKLDDMDSKYINLFDSNAANILSKIKLGMANIIDLGQVDESTAEVLVAHVLRTALKSRKNFVHGDKNALSFPVFFVLEEAHILAPNSRNTKCKYWVSRVAREGRKFGLGLCLVSQSPKSVDPDALSQANNMIILRLVEPKDQRHVQAASEALSDDLVNQLPSLNIGEALVLGLMTKVPTLVKVDEFKGRRVGDDIDILDQWRQSKKDNEEELERQRAESRALDGFY
ncbi:helicase HerA-like domain-containing protein [Methanobrevibacter wolinii]|uniref:helicase HerA-like domain-containing protein n=1 Tax=Methanobrevibacter wolinii TaxID=190977 RepID=UPI0005B2ABF3|nr:ATP-binding protein [Methanobrevibacter wolinii]